MESYGRLIWEASKYNNFFFNLKHAVSFHLIQNLLFLLTSYISKFLSFMLFFYFFLWPHKIGPYLWSLYTSITGNKTARKVRYNPPHVSSCLAYISQHTLYTISKLFLRSQLQSQSLYPLHFMKVTTSIDKQLPLDRRDMMADLVKPVCSLSSAWASIV